MTSSGKQGDTRLGPGIAQHHQGIARRTVIVDLDYHPADRMLERGELLIVTADNVALLRVIEGCGMFPRVGLTRG